MMNNSKNCVLRSNSVKPVSICADLTSSPDDDSPSKQSPLVKLLNRLNKSQSNLKTDNEMIRKHNEYNRSLTNVDQTETKLSLDDDEDDHENNNDEYKEEKTDVCSSLLNVNQPEDKSSKPKANRSTSMSKLATAKRRSSISSLFESASLTSQLDLSIFTSLQNRHERRRSTGHLTSKNLLNQIKNMNSMNTHEHSELDRIENIQEEMSIELKNETSNEIKSNNNSSVAVSIADKTHLKTVKAEASTSATLDILINIYNSELDYLKLLKNTFEIYAEPLRKFSSLTQQEHSLLFSNLEPILSLSLNLSIKLENIIKNCPLELNNSGKIFGKKLLQCYEEYLNNYSSIIKLLNQKLKQNELKEFCELRQSKSECQIALKDLLSAPLERIQYYEKSLQYLNDSISGSIPSTTPQLPSNSNLSSTNAAAKEENSGKTNNCNINYNYNNNNNNNNDYICSQNKCNNNSNNIDIEIIKRRTKKNRPFSTTHLFSNSNSSNNSNSKYSNELSYLTSNQKANLLLPVSAASSTSLYFNESNFVNWNTSIMKDKSESLINLNGGQTVLTMVDADSLLSSLACIQQSFPHDDLKLFEEHLVQTPDPHNAKTMSTDEPTSAGHQVKTGNVKFNFNNTTPSRKTSLLNFIQQPNRRKTFLVNEQQQKQSQHSQANDTDHSNTNRKKLTSSASFVSKHFLIQRRKTIHDIVDFDSLTNSTAAPTTTTDSTPTNHNLSNSNNENLLQSLAQSVNNLNLTHQSHRQQQTPNTTTADSKRELVKHGHVQLLNQYGKQERIFFLFSDLLIIAKQKNENHNKLKHRVLVSDIWLSDCCFDTIYWQYKQDTSIVIGWPPAFNFIADFRDSLKKDLWLNKFKELIAIEKKKQQDLTLNIKICFNKDNLGGSEPTQYSQCFTKTVQVKTHETAQDIVNRCKYLFNLEETLHSNNEETLRESSNVSQSSITQTSSHINNFQLWLKTGENEPLIPLIGHEFPFVIKMNFLREAHRSIKEDDNSYKFILIDKNATRNKNKSSNLNVHKPIVANNLPNSKTTNLIQPSDNDYEDKLQKLRKKIFWPRHSVSKSNTFNQNLNNFVSSPVKIPSTTTNITLRPSSPEFTSNRTTTNRANDFNSKLVKKLKQSNEPADNQFRSNSLNHVGSNHTSTKNNQPEVDSAAGSSSSSSSSLSMSTHLAKNVHTETTIIADLKNSFINNNNTNNTTNSTITTSTNSSSLRPFYNKLKKTHLFGVKLEKLCGIYHPTGNNQLPLPIINLMEKVASEGSTSLMIFRKSASAKLKKTFKEKLDSHQTIDYNEMNVHVAALLLKEYLRDYPDGIIDYRLYNDLLNTLKISDQDLRAKTTQNLLNKLPKWNLVCLKHFMCLFSCILINSQINKMDSHNISVCVAPSIFHKLDRPSDVESSFQAIAFIKYLIDNCRQLFGPDLFSLLQSSQSLLPKKESITSDAVSSLSSFSSNVDPVQTEQQNLHHLNEIKQTKPVKNKREIGRMLNLVSLKGRKPLTNTITDSNKKSGSCSSSNENEATKNQIEIITANSKNLSESESTKQRADTNSYSSMDNYINLCDFKSTDLTTTNPAGSKLRRRTSTNNGNSSILVINDEDAEQNFVYNHENDDDDYEDYDFNEATTEESGGKDLEDDEECFNELISHQYSRRRSNHRNINLVKLKHKMNQTNNNNSASLNINTNINANINNNNNKHDLSSNTLSVDSGLSVPTATNSDPESEKSANLNNVNFEESLKKEIDNLKNFYLTTNEYNMETENGKHDDTLTKSLANQTHLLKRQRRMLFLKVDSDDANNESLEDVPHFSYDPSQKPLAPIAPKISSDDYDDNNDVELEVDEIKRINNHFLIPYNTDSMPSHYQKKKVSQSQQAETQTSFVNKNKRIAPTVNDLISQTSAMTLVKLDNFESLITSSATVSSKSNTDLRLKPSVSLINRKPIVKIDVLVENLKENVKNSVSAGVGLVALNNIDFYNLNNQPWLSEKKESTVVDSKQSEMNSLKIATDILIKMPSSPASNSPASSICSSNTNVLLQNKRKNPNNTNIIIINNNNNNNTNMNMNSTQIQKRKLSKSLKDYRPSKHFVENLNLKSSGFQPIKKNLGSCSSSSSSSGDLSEEINTECKNSRKTNIKINRKSSNVSQSISRSSSGNGTAAFKKTIVEPSTKRVAKRSSSIQVNNSIKPVAAVNQHNKNNQKEVRRSISLKNKLETVIDSPPAIGQIKSKPISNGDSSAFKPVNKSNQITSNNIKQNEIKPKSQMIFPARNNSMASFQHTNSNNIKTISSLNSNSASSVSSASLVSGPTPQRKPLAIVSQSAGPSKLVEVTWSVSSIKKRFETPNSRNLESANVHQSFKSNRNLLTGEDRSESRKTNLNNINEKVSIYLNGYKDSNGDSVTYI